MTFTRIPQVSGFRKYPLHATAGLLVMATMTAMSATPAISAPVTTSATVEGQVWVDLLHPVSSKDVNAVAATIDLTDTFASSNAGVDYTSEGSVSGSAQAEISRQHVIVGGSAYAGESPVSAVGDGTSSFGAHVYVQASTTYTDTVTVAGPYAPGTRVGVTAWVFLHGNIISTVSPICNQPHQEDFSPASGSTRLEIRGPGYSIGTIYAGIGGCGGSPIASIAFDGFIGDSYDLLGFLDAKVILDAESDDFSRQSAVAVADFSNTAYTYFTFDLPDVVIQSAGGGTYLEPVITSDIPAPASLPLLATGLAGFRFLRRKRAA